MRPSCLLTPEKKKRIGKGQQSTTTAAGGQGHPHCSRMIAPKCASIYTRAALPLWTKDIFFLRGHSGPKTCIGLADSLGPRRRRWVGVLCCLIGNTKTLTFPCAQETQALFVSLKFSWCWCFIREKHCLYTEKYCWSSSLSIYIYI
jgi:hypothetical protein